MTRSSRWAGCRFRRSPPGVGAAESQPGKIGPFSCTNPLTRQLGDHNILAAPIGEADRSLHTGGFATMFNRHRSIRFALLLPIASASRGCGSRSVDPAQLPPPAPAARSEQLIAEPAIVSLGTLTQGHAGRGRVVVRNTTNEPIRVERFSTGCSCIRVTPTSCSLPPGGRAELEVAFDPTESPEFRGDLAVGVDGNSAQGVHVLRFVVLVRVEPIPAVIGNSLHFKSEVVR